MNYITSKVQVLVTSKASADQLFLEAKMAAGIIPYASSHKIGGSYDGKRPMEFARSRGHSYVLLSDIVSKIFKIKNVLTEEKKRLKGSMACGR